METLHRQLHFPSFSDVKQPAFNITSYTTTSLPSATASSTFSDSQDDLLPDLWLEEPKKYTSGFPTDFGAPKMPDANNYNTTAMLREASLEYAQLLLPHSLLAPLTEENLDYNDSLSGEQFFRAGAHAQKKCSHEPHAEHARPNNTHNAPKARRGLLSSTSSKGKNINTQLYKTELCVSYMKMGGCPYGAKCQFAHGEHDLKSVPRPANYRSKPCSNWAKYGSCRYGKRCCFKHGD